MTCFSQNNVKTINNTLQGKKKNKKICVLCPHIACNYDNEIYTSEKNIIIKIHIFLMHENIAELLYEHKGYLMANKKYKCNT